jgi:DNA-binding NtrC family response regulator
LNSVLIVDDESAIREILRRWLSDQGYDIREAPDAEAALEEMGRAVADVVMCDVEMPGHGGLWLAAELERSFPATAIVLATAVDSVPPVTSLRPGIVDYLVKPFAQHIVLATVSRAVEWHRVALARGPAPKGDAERVTSWLDSMEE